MSDNTLATADTGSEQENNQAVEKFYTQKEVDDMMARTKNAITKKFSSKYEDLGDIEELRQLKSQHEQQQLELQKKRGQFDEIIRDLAQKKDEEIRKRDEIIKGYTVDVPLVNAAAQFRAVNADQVKALLKPQVRLNTSGEVEVLDNKGPVRYNDQGQPFGVADFVAAGASTSNGKSNIGRSQEKLDISKLDFKNPNDRRLYKEMGLGLNKK